MTDESREHPNRGSEWCRWEPHIHAPGTLREDRYSGDDVWDRYLHALETASPNIRAIGITDYCITRSYERVKAYKDDGRLIGCDLLFPNIELRLNTGTVKGNFVNIHLLASPEDPDHVTELNRFLGKLVFPAFDDRFACTPPDLMRLGQKADPTKTKAEAALAHGASQFKVSRENLMDAYQNTRWAKDNIVIAVAANADGASGVREASDTTIREEIEKAAHAMFASSLKQRDFWLGQGAASIDELHERYDGPKPCLWGCDAHEMSMVAKPAEDRLCWIKGVPTFDALRQVCIDPERAFVGPVSPSPATPSQIIDEIIIENAPWALTPRMQLNPGLVAVIGARGSGKTALADIIAAGCDSYEASNSKASKSRASFLERAEEHMSGARVSLKWLGDEKPVSRSLDAPENNSPDAYKRALYLSQQFVEDLCSVEGMPKLIEEIERVIFEAHPPVERDGAVDFEELLALRASRYRDARAREEASLTSLSDQIGVELEKSRQIGGLKSRIAEKDKLIRRYQKDRVALFPKNKDRDEQAVNRLQELVAAADKVRSYLRHFAKQEASIANIKSDVGDLRENRAPDALRSMREKYKSIDLDDPTWEQFLLRYSGDVDRVIASQSDAVSKHIKSLKGEVPISPIDEGSAYLESDTDLSKVPLALLSAEIERLEKIVAADKDTANRLSAVSKRLNEETAALEQLKERLEDCEGAADRARDLVKERENGYRRIFEAILNEQNVLNDLYAPLMGRLKVAGNTLGKLSFSVNRIADVSTWAKHGEEDLFDRRGGPFRGVGSLEKVATAIFQEEWETGDSDSVLQAMTDFRAKYEDVLLEQAPFLRDDDSNYRPWTRRFAQWLYSTRHITIEYGIKYDDVDIRSLSPGTRGIVLVLLYLALDDADDRPLIIDQPEENLDPQSIYKELVPLFQSAKDRRQVIMVTHNANLVVNTDADQIVIARVGTGSGEGVPPITYRSGGLDEAEIRKEVCEILEGGEAAFKHRAERLRIALRK